MVTSRATITAQQKVGIRKEWFEIMHFNTKIAGGVEGLTEVEWSGWSVSRGNGGGGAWSTPNFAPEATPWNLRDFLEYVGKITRLTHSWLLQIKVDETMSESLILEK